MYPVRVGVQPVYGASPDFTLLASSVGVAQAAPGVTVTTGASSADGTAVSLISSPLAFDCQQLVIAAGVNAATGVDTSTLLDILVDPAGGTSWANLILSLPAGFMLTTTTPYARTWTFPIFIAAGSTIGCRGRNATGSTRAVLVDCWVYGGSTRKRWVGRTVDAYGDTRASSLGTRVAPNAGADTFGNWISIGSTTSKQYGALYVSCQGDDLSMATHGHVAQFGISSTQVGQSMAYTTNAAEWVGQPFPGGLIQKTIPLGTQLQVRDKASNTSGDSCQFIIHGIA